MKKSEDITHWSAWYLHPQPEELVWNHRTPLMSAITPEVQKGPDASIAYSGTCYQPLTTVFDTLSTPENGCQHDVASLGLRESTQDDAAPLSQLVYILRLHLCNSEVGQLQSIEWISTCATERWARAYAALEFAGNLVGECPSKLACLSKPRRVEYNAKNYQCTAHLHTPV